MNDKDMYFIENVLAVALHESQRCPHGRGTDPKPMAKDYMKADQEWASDIATEYRRIYAALELDVVEKTLDEMVEQGLLERVDA